MNSRNIAPEPFLYSINAALEVVPIGRTMLYRAIADGLIGTKKYGRRTLIPAAELRRFATELPNGAAKRPSQAAARRAV